MLVQCDPVVATAQVPAACRELHQGITSARGESEQARKCHHGRARIIRVARHVGSCQGVNASTLMSLGRPRRTRVESDRLRGNSRQTAEPEVANLGLIRPPLVYLGAIALGPVFHALWPVYLVPHSLGTPVGVVVTLIAGALFLSAVRTFRAAGTRVPGNRPATTIVRTGPYRFSRNPIYLAFSLLQLGLALWVNSLGLLITLVPAVALMSFVVVPREERYLEARFPSEYAPYKASVRRWF
jgi:protein-S-isoprenylcysteine O-methyltransferase Ste14